MIWAQNVCVVGDRGSLKFVDGTTFETLSIHRGITSSLRKNWMTLVSGIIERGKTNNSECKVMHLWINNKNFCYKQSLSVRNNQGKERPGFIR